MPHVKTANLFTFLTVLLIFRHFKKFKQMHQLAKEDLIIFAAMFQSIGKKYTLYFCGLFLFTSINAQVEKSDHSNLRLLKHGDSIGKWDIHFQNTYITQYKPTSFTGGYDGPNSLGGNSQRQNSQTSTLYLGIRILPNGVLYINPEVAGGSGLSGALGMAGSSNGETFRIGNPSPTLYCGRFYYLHTFNLGKKSAYLAEDANQLGDFQSPKNIKIALGKFCLGDFFDNNNYSNSPRTQFLNWSAMNNGAWDYAADVRGYTYAASAMFESETWSSRIAATALPTSANGPDLNLKIKNNYSLNVEIQRNYTINKNPGSIRLLGFVNHTNMGSYRQVIENPIQYNYSIINTRLSGRNKYGVGLNIEQSITSSISAFGRLGWNDGKTETWCFTEIDKTALLGVSINGTGWNRSSDVLGIATMVNGLSAPHRNYIAMGGLGFILGDGKLNYKPEGIFEIYYSSKPSYLPIWITADYQFCVNPGYNADKGPVHIFSIRTHIEL